jgi:putative transposase
MKMTRYSEPQILAILRQAEGGMPVAELCREHGMSNATFYKWRAKYGHGCIDDCSDKSLGR